MSDVPGSPPPGPTSPVGPLPPPGPPTQAVRPVWGHPGGPVGPPPPGPPTQPAGPAGPSTSSGPRSAGAVPSGPGAIPIAAPGPGPNPPVAGGPSEPQLTDDRSRRRSPLRIIGRALLVLVVIGALAGTTAWGFTNRSSAERWRDRSEAADADLRRSLRRVDATGEELEDARDRLRDLAAENAGETDRNRILSDVVAQAPEVTSAMRSCQEQSFDVTNEVIDAFGNPNANVPELNRRIRSVERTCQDALDAALALEQTIDELDP